MQGTFLNIYEASLDYGVSENVLINISFPYLTLADVDDGGAFGDFSTSIKVLLAEQSDAIMWRTFASFYFRFPTGISPQDSYRKIGEKTVSYYPFASGNYCFSPSLLMSLIIDEFAINLTVFYQAENSASEGFFSFRTDNDRFDFQLSADYPFKIDFSGIDPISIRPAVYLDYKYNISSLPIIPDSWYLTLENNIKIGEYWKIRFYYTIPITDNGIYKYSLCFQVGRYF